MDDIEAGAIDVALSRLEGKTVGTVRLRPTRLDGTGPAVMTIVLDDGTEAQMTTDRIIVMRPNGWATHWQRVS